jgi:hypothetical protein
MLTKSKKYPSKKRLWLDKSKSSRLGSELNSRHLCMKEFSSDAQLQISERVNSFHTSCLECNVVQYLPGLADWANFRTMGDCELWTVFFLISETAHIIGLLFPRLRICINFDKKGLGHILGDFLQTQLVTLASSNITVRFSKCTSETKLCSNVQSKESVIRLAEWSNPLISEYFLITMIESRRNLVISFHEDAVGQRN